MPKLTLPSNQHVCGYKGCQNIVDNKYHFCYKHKNRHYKDICYIHGETWFVRGKCQICQENEVPLYRVFYRNGKYYRGRAHVPIDKSSYLYKYCKVLTHKSKRYQKKFIGNVIAAPGTYGIFVRRGKGLGECLYVGQSTNIKRRIGQHKEAILDVKHNKNSNQRLLYHKLAQYPMKKLRFVKLYAVPKQEWRKLDRHQKFELLTFFEQLAMDVYKPKFNKIAARMTEA